MAADRATGKRFGCTYRDFAFGRGPHIYGWSRPHLPCGAPDRDRRRPGSGAGRGPCAGFARTPTVRRRTRTGRAVTGWGMANPTLDEASDALIAKWSTPKGVELIREGAKIVGHLMESGPLPVPVADAMLPEGDRATGMLRYFSDRDYDLELDADGDIAGAGLSLLPSAVHTSEIGGRRYYNWCMMDAVMFPVIFGLVSPVTTECPATATRITMKVTPEGIAELSSPDAWFTLAPATGGEVRAVFCDRVNFYATEGAARAAAAADPDLAVGPAAEAFTVAKRLADLF